MEGRRQPAGRGSAPGRENSHRGPLPLSRLLLAPPICRTQLETGEKGDPQSTGAQSKVEKGGEWVCRGRQDVFSVRIVCDRCPPQSLSSDISGMRR